MSNLITLLAVSCFMVACSGSGGGGGTGPAPGVTPFEKATSGLWMSDCFSNQGIPTRDMLTLSNGGKGSTRLVAFQTQDCSGNGQAEMESTFTYKVTSTQGDTSKVALSFADGRKADLTLKVAGNELFADMGQGPLRYQRADGGQGGGDGGGNPGTGFEAVGAGTWISDCMQAQNTLYRELLTLQGGRGTSTLLFFRNQQCSGDAQADQPTEFTYQVKSTQGNTSQITLNMRQGKNINVAVTVTGDFMTVSSPQGSLNYQRARAE